MSPQAKEEYFKVLFKRYKEASRTEKAKIIDECCAVCDYHRKHAIRRLRGYKRFTKPRKKKRGRPSVYNKEVIIQPLKQIWLAANLPDEEIEEVAEASEDMESADEEIAV